MRIIMCLLFSILVHPCDKPNKGGCSQLCNKRKEWHVCSCKAGFLLAEDKKTCKKGMTDTHWHVNICITHHYNMVGRRG